MPVRATAEERRMLALRDLKEVESPPTDVSVSSGRGQLVRILM